MKRLLERCRQLFCTEDLYKVLKTHPKCTAKEVRKAYIELSLKYHPDKVPEKERKLATEKFKVINQAYSIINDEEKRKSYDATVASRQPRKKPSIWREKEQPTSSHPREQSTDESANRSGANFAPFDNLRSTFVEQIIDIDKQRRDMEVLMRHMRYIGNLLHRFEDTRTEMYRHPRLTSRQPREEHIDRVIEGFKLFEEQTRNKENVLHHVGSLFDSLEDLDTRAEMYRHPRRNIPKYFED